MASTKKGGLIGFGFIAEHGHAPAYLALGRDRFEIVAIADVCEARREKARAIFPGARVYSSHQELLARERGRLDFADVAVPPASHAPIAHAALDAGLHVFCEKPLATRREDAARLLEHARRAQRVIFPSHNYRHAPVVKSVRRVLDQDLIGRVSLVTLQTFRSTHARGVAEWRPDWRRERAHSGGGIAMDHGAHTFYLAFDWLGRFPTSITAKTATRGAYDTEDDVSCTATFPNGLMTAQLTWNAGIRKVIYTLHGERGAIRVEDDEMEVAVAAAGPGSWEIHRENVSSRWMDASHAGWFRALFERFEESMRRGEYVAREAFEAYKCVELIEAVYESSRNGSREIFLPDGQPQVLRPLLSSVG